jgi:hypothetical protein
MKRLIKFGSVGLVIAGAIAISESAFAQVPAATRFVNAQSQYTIYITGTPRTQVPVALGNLQSTVTRTFSSNGCGHVIIPNANLLSSLTTPVGSVNLTNVLARPMIAPPVCTGQTSTALGTSADSAYNLGDNRVLINLGSDSTAPSGKRVDFTYTDNSPRQAFVSLNACGVGSINSRTLSNTATIAINGGAPVEFSTLPSSQLRCGGTNVLGLDANFPTPSVPDTWIGTEGSTQYVFHKTTPNATVEYQTSSAAPVNRSVTSDRCGGLTIGTATSPQLSDFSIGGTLISVGSLPVGLRPTCKLTSGTYAYDVVPSGNFKTSDGRVFLKSIPSLPTGFGDRRIYTISTQGSTTTRTARANGCGIARLPFETNMINGTFSDFNLSDPFSATCVRGTGNTFSIFKKLN